MAKETNGEICLVNRLGAWPRGDSHSEEAEIRE